MSVTVIEAIRAILLGSNDVAAMVGTRIGPWRAAQSWPTPYITLFKVSEPHSHNMTGSDGLTNPRVQLDAWADDYDEATQLGEYCRLALDGYMGEVLVGETPFIFKHLFIDSSSDGAEEESSASENVIFRVRQDYKVWHSETIPTH